MAVITTDCCSDPNKGVILFDGVGMYEIRRSDGQPLIAEDQRAIVGMAIALRIDDSIPDVLKGDTK